MDRFELSVGGACGPRSIRLMVASSMLERMRGLLGRPDLQAAEGMLLQSCRLIHTFGMRYPIDLVYLDRKGRVLKVTPALPARRMDGAWRAHSVLEMAAGEAGRCGIVPGLELPIARMVRLQGVPA
jgi:uncharacterized membrane protein (UPF0127 family)